MHRQLFVILAAGVLFLGCTRSNDNSEMADLRKQVSDLELRVATVENDLKTLTQAEAAMPERTNDSNADMIMMERWERFNKRHDLEDYLEKSGPPGSYKNQ